MVVGTLSLVQKGQTCGVPTTIGHYSTASTATTSLTFCTKDNVPTTIYHYSTVFTGLTFFAPKTMFPPPYTTILLHPLHTASTAYCIYCVLHPLVCSFCTKDNVSTTIYHYSTVSTAYYIHWFDLFAPKTMSPPPYSTIPLRPLCTASTASTHSSHLCVILTQPDIL